MRLCKISSVVSDLKFYLILVSNFEGGSVGAAKNNSSSETLTPCLEID